MGDVAPCVLDVSLGRDTRVGQAGCHVGFGRFQVGASFRKKDILSEEITCLGILFVYHLNSWNGGKHELVH